MALSGKKITELNPISDVTNKTVLPTVYIDDTYTEATATKVTVQQLKTNILNGAVLQPNIITDTESTSIELNKILANPHNDEEERDPGVAARASVQDDLVTACS